VVEDISGDYQVKVGNMQYGGVIGVAVTDFDDDELVTFEGEPVVFNGLGEDG
jgi:hypothetical protein